MEYPTRSRVVSSVVVDRAEVGAGVNEKWTALGELFQCSCFPVPLPAEIRTWSQLYLVLLLSSCSGLSFYAFSRSLVTSLV